MISQSLALKLKKAGLKWTPALHDFFALPERGFDDRIFVISDLQSTIETLFGVQVVAFQGASEWALDYLETSEAVWMPTEEQLRWAIEDCLPHQRQIHLTLTCFENGYRLEIIQPEQNLIFEAADASEAYGEALLFLLTSHTG